MNVPTISVTISHQTPAGDVIGLDFHRLGFATSTIPLADFMKLERAVRAKTVSALKGNPLRRYIEMTYPFCHEMCRVEVDIPVV